ncbi:MAG: hypothetical protein LDL39_00940 [Magnetospirillum sp.]|nr:hypothetical protein [Magnetospirillum sp.]
MENPCVMVVDDNKANRDLYMDLLEMTPFTGSGMEVARDIFAAMGADAPPILAMTASALPDLIDRLQEHGFVGLVTKPCGVSTFLAAVHWGMGGKHQEFKLF